MAHLEHSSPLPSIAPLGEALAAVGACWLFLIVAPAALRPATSNPTLAAFTLAMIAVIAMLWRRGERPDRTTGWRLGLGLAAGIAGFTACLGGIVALGLALGLPAAPADDAAQWPRPESWLGSAVVAPIFEEGLYRGLLLPALRRHTGALAAVVVSSAAFALPHLEAWSVLGTFCVGLGLGAVRLASGSVAPTIGLHAGLNASALAGALPSALAGSDAPGAALFGSLLRSIPT